MIKISAIKTAGRWGAMGGLLLMGMFLGGCSSGSPRYSDSGGASPPPSTAASQPDNPAAEGANAKPGSEILQVGQTLIISLTDTGVKIEPFVQKIRPDGTVTLLQEKTFEAAGQTRSQLETNIFHTYVPDYYKHMTVTVTLEGQSFWVDGEVKTPNGYNYTGPITVLKAIATAGYFTEFANKRKVQLTHANGRIEIINCLKAQKNPKLDLEVFPGDKIRVPRRVSPF